jgi:putative endonuclease
MAGLVPAIPFRRAGRGAILRLYPRQPPRRRDLHRRDKDLLRRIYEHKNGLVAGHTKLYGIDKLVYFEIYDSIHQAIQREKNIKHWPRAWKTRLIAQSNAEWRDLYAEIA